MLAAALEGGLTAALADDPLTHAISYDIRW